MLDSIVALFSGLLLYAAGAMVWVIRSNYRRRDKNKKRQRGALPEGAYEFMPFVYIGLGVLLLALSSNPLFYPSAVLFIAAGTQAWLMRAVHRSRAIAVH